MDFQMLSEIGLTQAEAKTYLALLELKSAPVKKISEKSGMHRKNVYDALDKLIAKGFAASVVGSRAKSFMVTNPDNILSYLKEKEDKVRKWIPEIENKYSLEQDADEALVFRGIGGIKAILQDMLKVKSELLLIGSKGQWKLQPGLKYFFPQFEKERIKLGIKIRQIFDYELRRSKITKFDLEEHRFFPKQYSTPIHIWIYGNRVVSLFYGDEPTAFMIKSRKIANGYTKYFNYLWKKSS